MSAGPERLGHYRILRELGRGGMGVVYEVERDDTGGRFALKTLTLGLGADPELSARFAREGQLAARLDHMHVVRTHAAMFEGPHPWIVQDLLPGGSLRDRLRASGPFTVDDGVDVVRKVALGLAHAHERGVLHRDVKPENVLFDEEGEPRLVDFGVARPTTVGASAQLTATGQVIGSPAFMAPEQAIGDRVDARADVHAAGALLHTLLAGDPPFAGVSALEIIEAVISKPPRPLRALRPDVPEAVERVVLRALAKRPDDRYATAAELAKALAECRAAPAPPPTSRVVPALIAASVASTALAVVALVASGPRVPTTITPPTTTTTTTPTIAEPDEPAPRPTTGWPGLGPTFAEPMTFEIVRDIRDPAITDIFRMTLHAQPAVPTQGGHATIAMTVSRIAFLLQTAIVRVDYDSADPEKPPPPLDGMSALLERALASRLTVDVVLATGEVTSVTGLPNAAFSEVSNLAAALPQVLRDGVLRSLLDNTWHLFPERPADDGFVATTWIDEGAGFRGPRRVRARGPGELELALAGEARLRTWDGSPPRGVATDARVTASAQLDGDRLATSELDLQYFGEAREKQWRIFRFRRLPDAR